MNKEKVLSLTLDVNKSLWKYWEGIQKIFNIDMNFLIKEMELCDDIIEKLIGYQDSEKNICSDPIINAVHEYNNDTANINDAVNNLLAIERFLKVNNLYHKFHIDEIVENFINLYLYIEEVNNQITKFFDSDETSLYNELSKLEKIINIIFDFKSDYLKGDVLIRFIESQLLYNDVEEITVILRNTGKILE
jgi:hypothetical protein